MAAPMRTAFSYANAVPFFANDVPDCRNSGCAMVEILLIAQLMRSPLQALARRWYCRSLFRATRGRRHCAECPRT